MTSSVPFRLDLDKPRKHILHGRRFLSQENIRRLRLNDYEIRTLIGLARRTVRTSNPVLDAGIGFCAAAGRQNVLRAYVPAIKEHVLGMR